MELNRQRRYYSRFVIAIKILATEKSDKTWLRKKVGKVLVVGMS
jgi:hypothetical protein